MSKRNIWEKGYNEEWIVAISTCHGNPVEQRKEERHKKEQEIQEKKKEENEENKTEKKEVSLCKRWVKNWKYILT